MFKFSFWVVLVALAALSACQLADPYDVFPSFKPGVHISWLGVGEPDEPRVGIARLLEDGDWAVAVETDAAVLDDALTRGCRSYYGDIDLGEAIWSYLRANTPNRTVSFRPVDHRLEPVALAGPEWRGQILFRIENINARRVRGEGVGLRAIGVFEIEDHTGRRYAWRATGSALGPARALDACDAIERAARDALYGSAVESLEKILGWCPRPLRAGVCR